jgi:lysyl-tRNA synthetase class 2
MTIKSYFFRDSSFITNVSYSEDTEVLYIKFNSGTTWVYYDVSQEVYNRLVKSTSVGEYFNKNIRNKYSSQRINYKIEDSQNVQEQEKEEKEQKSLS